MTSGHMKLIALERGSNSQNHIIYPLSFEILEQPHKDSHVKV